MHPDCPNTHIHYAFLLSSHIPYPDPKPPQKSKAVPRVSIPQLAIPDYDQRHTSSPDNKDGAPDLASALH